MGGHEQSHDERSVSRTVPNTTEIEQVHQSTLEVLSVSSVSLKAEMKFGFTIKLD